MASLGHTSFLETRLIFVGSSLRTLRMSLCIPGLSTVFVAGGVAERAGPRGPGSPAPLPAAFYTSRYGYKMCLRIYLDGDGTGRGTHLSLFFVVMKGPNDALLRWPFNQKVREPPPRGRPLSPVPALSPASQPLATGGEKWRFGESI